MINPHELVSAPKPPEETPPPFLSADQVRTNIQAKIDDIVRKIESPIRLGQATFVRTNGLFGMSSRSEFSVLTEANKYEKPVVGRASSEMVQDVTFEVMSRYGFNPNISRGTYKDIPWNHSDGTSRELLDYPSQTIPGLTFERRRDYYTETGKDISVSWSVKDKSPSYRVNLRTLFQRPQPQNPKTA